MTAQAAGLPGALVEFSLTRGGLLDRIEHATRIERDDPKDLARQCAVVWAVAWLPLVLIGLVQWLLTHRVSGVLLDFSAQARPLIAVPLFLVGERVADERTRLCTSRLVEWRLVTGSDLPKLQGIFARASRLRDSAAIEIALMVLAFAGGQIAIWGFGAAGLMSRRAHGGLDFAWFWYGFITLPLFQFLLFRWVLRWWIWTRVLAQVARLDLHLEPTHPDRVGGLMTMQEASSGFVLVYMGLSAVLSATWLEQVLFSGARALEFARTLAVFVVLLLAVTVGPLMVFAGRLWRIRRRGLWDHSHLGLRYTRQFHHRWVQGDREEVLDAAPDLEGLSNLANCHENIAHMQVVPFSRAMIVAVLVAILVPMIPLALTAMPVSELLAHLGRALLGGMR